PNFKSSNGALSPFATQTVTKASTSIGLVSVSPAPAFVGQPITVSYTFGVAPPGGGSPIVPTGSITVVSSDGSACTPLALGLGCTLSPAPTAAGTYTLTLTYSGDGNFLGTGSNGNPYSVYQLVFTTSPSNTGVGNTITPAVVVTAEDSSSNPLDGNGGRINFTGGIT